MRVLKILLPLPVLAYAAAMGYLWNEVKSSADEMVQAAAPFAKISYNSVHISLLGNEVGLDDVIIQPLMTQDEFRIEQVRINAPHIGYFIGASNRMENGQLPEQLGMHIRHMHLDLNSEFFTMMENMQQQVAMTEDDDITESFLSPDALGCGELTTFTLKDYRRMGLGNIIADASINIGYDEQLNRTFIKVNTSADNLYDMGIVANFDTNPEALSTAITTNEIPDTTFNYRDTGYFQLRNDYCAKLNHSGVTAYVDRHIGLLDESVGATFPKETLSAYKQFMLNGGSFSIGFELSDDLNFNGLEYYHPADIIDMMGLSLTINKTRVDTDQIQWDIKRKETARSSISQEAKPPAFIRSELPSAIKVTPVDSEQRRVTPSFKNIEIVDADKHLHRMVEVTTFEGKVRSGVLDEINKERIYLVMTLKAGTITYPVVISDIDQIKVSY